MKKVISCAIIAFLVISCSTTKHIAFCNREVEQDCKFYTDLRSEYEEGEDSYEELNILIKKAFVNNNGVISRSDWYDDIIDHECDY